jgi:hypothetical protein
MKINLTLDQRNLLLSVLRDAEDNAHREAYSQAENQEMWVKALTLSDLVNAILI